MLWEGDQGQTGWFIHSYQSLWIPQTLLDPARQATLVEALFAATRNWSVALHFNGAGRRAATGSGRRC